MLTVKWFFLISYNLMLILFLFPSFYECSHTNSSCSCSKIWVFSVFLIKKEEKSGGRGCKKEEQNTIVIVGPTLHKTSR